MLIYNSRRKWFLWGRWKPVFLSLKRNERISPVPTNPAAGFDSYLSELFLTHTSIFSWHPHPLHPSSYGYYCTFSISSPSPLISPQIFAPPCLSLLSSYPSSSSSSSFFNKSLPTLFPLLSSPLSVLPPHPSLLLAQIAASAITHWLWSLAARVSRGRQRGDIYTGKTILWVRTLQHWSLIWGMILHFYLVYNNKFIQHSLEKIQKQTISNQKSCHIHLDYNGRSIQERVYASTRVLSCNSGPNEGRVWRHRLRLDWSQDRFSGLKCVMVPPPQGRYSAGLRRMFVCWTVLHNIILITLSIFHVL